MFYISKLINNSLQQAFCKGFLRIGHNKSANINSFSNTKELTENLHSLKVYYKTLIHNDMVISNSLRKRIGFAFSTSTEPYRQTGRLIKDIREKVQQQQVNVIQVKAQSQELLFIDSDTLQSHIKMQQLRHKIKTTTTITRRLESNQSQSPISINKQGLIRDQNQNQPINRLQQFNKIATSITECNEYLSKGHFQQYKDYPLVKLTEICLRLINEHNGKIKEHTEKSKQSNSYQGVNVKKGGYENRTLQQHWRQLQYYTRKRMHNCSLKDYMRILYITLHSYRQIHKFSHNFMDSLIKGLKHQIPLMEESQLMQLYIILSQNQLSTRYQYQLGLRYSRKYQNDEIVKSPFYEHEMLYKLQEEIAQKIVKKYQKKYMKTQLSLKDQDLHKITWWLKSILLFQNTKFSLIKENLMGNEKKNQYIVGLVNVLLSKYIKQSDNQVISQGMKRLIQYNKQSGLAINNNNNKIKSNGSSYILQNKSVRFNNIDQLIQFVFTLSFVRDYLKIQSQTQTVKNVNKSDDIVLDKNEIWQQKSHSVNTMIKTIVNYGNVQQMIQCLFKNEQMVTVDKDQEINKQQDLCKLTQSNNYYTDDNNNKFEQFNIQKAHSKLQILKSLSQCKENQNNPKLVHQWCLQLINKYNIFLLLQQSNNSLNNNTHSHQLQFKQLSPQQRLNIVECQLHIVYMLYNNVYYVNNLYNKSSMLREKDNNYGIEKLWLCYKDIVQNCFINNQDLTQQTNIQLPPSSILKMIYFELSFNQITKQQQRNNTEIQEYPAKYLIKKYAQNMLQINNCVNNPNIMISFYVRELQLPLYTYLACIFKSIQNNIPTQIQSQILTILQTIKSRNDKSKHYLQQQNIQYQSIINTHHFINANPSYLLPQQNNSLSLMNNTNKHSNQHNKQTVLLGQYMMKCLEKEKKEWLRNEQIVKLTKFFTEIKAFNELKFSHPVTVFTVTAQFLFSIDSSNKKVNKIDNIQPKVLMFLSPQQLIKPDIIAQKVIYQTQGLEMIVIDRKQFLNMHINQRIQKLNQILFSKNTPSPLRYLLAK